MNDFVMSLLMLFYIFLYFNVLFLIGLEVIVQYPEILGAMLSTEINLLGYYKLGSLDWAQSEHPAHRQGLSKWPHPSVNPKVVWSQTYQVTFVPEKVQNFHWHDSGSCFQASECAWDGDYFILQIHICICAHMCPGFFFK